MVLLCMSYHIISYHELSGCVLIITYWHATTDTSVLPTTTLFWYLIIVQFRILSRCGAEVVDYSLIQVDFT